MDGINYLIARGNVPQAEGFDYLDAQKGATDIQTKGMQNELARQQLAAEPEKQKMRAMMLELKDIGLDIREKALKSGPTVEIPFTLNGKNYKMKGPSEPIAKAGAAINADPNSALDPNLIPWLASQQISVEEVTEKESPYGPAALKFAADRAEIEAKIKEKYKTSDEKDPATADIKKYEVFAYGKLRPELRGSPDYQKGYLDFLKITKEQSPYAQAIDRQIELTAKTQGTILRKEFYDSPPVKTYQEMSRQYDVMKEAMKESKTTQNFVGIDQALISIFNKMTDPASVVRESEYERTPSNLPLINRFYGAFEKIKKGGAGLTQDDREALTKMAGKLEESAKKKYKSKYHEYTKLLSEYGLNPEKYLNPSDKGEGSAPPEAIDYLKQHPEAKNDFKAKYGYLPEGL